MYGTNLVGPKGGDLLVYQFDVVVATPKIVQVFVMALRHLVGFDFLPDKKNVAFKIRIAFHLWALNNGFTQETI